MASISQTTAGNWWRDDDELCAMVDEMEAMATTIQEALSKLSAEYLRTRNTRRKIGGGK